MFPRRQFVGLIAVGALVFLPAAAHGHHPTARPCLYGKLQGSVG